MAQALDSVVTDIASTLLIKPRSSFRTHSLRNGHCRPHVIATVLNVSDLVSGIDRLRDSKASHSVILGSCLELFGITSVTNHYTTLPIGIPSIALGIA